MNSDSDTAVAGSVSRHSNVAAFPKAGPPAVLDDPVVRSVPHNQDCVVNRWPVAAPVHSARVLFPPFGAHCCRYRPVLQHLDYYIVRHSVHRVSGFVRYLYQITGVAETVGQSVRGGEGSIRVFRLVRQSFF